MNATQEEKVWAQALAATIRAESAARGMRDVDMVAATGIPSTTYWRLRRGDRAVDAVQLRQIARAFGITPGRLFDLADARAAESHIDESLTKTRAWIDRQRPPSGEVGPIEDDGDDAGLGSG